MTLGVSAAAASNDEEQHRCVLCGRGSGVRPPCRRSGGATGKDYHSHEWKEHQGFVFCAGCFGEWKTGREQYRAFLLEKAELREAPGFTKMPQAFPSRIAYYQALRRCILTEFVEEISEERRREPTAGELLAGTAEPAADEHAKRKRGKANFKIELPRGTPDPNLADNVVELRCPGSPQVHKKLFWVERAEFLEPTSDIRATASSTNRQASTKLLLRGFGPGLMRLEEVPEAALWSIGFAGDTLSRWTAATDLLFDESTEKLNSSLEAMIVDPRRLELGTYKKEATLQKRAEDEAARAEDQPCPLHPQIPIMNSSQEAAVMGATYRLEVLHGPPGTGKSTTVLQYLCRRLPERAAAVVTCVGNQALDAVCEKLGQAHESGILRILVLGAETRMGRTARRFTVEELVKSDQEVLSMARTLRVACESQPAPDVEGRRDDSEGEKGPAEKDGRNFHESLEDCVELDQAKESARKRLVTGAQAFLVTVSSSHRLLSLVEKYKEVLSNKRMFAAVLDEAGATSETYVPLLLRLGIENLVLLGDHRQLPPLVKGDPISVARAKADRSLMERIADCRPSACRMLREQYRMFPGLGSLVSKLFYEGKLLNGKVEGPPLPGGVRRLRWLGHKGLEKSVGTSYENPIETATICELLSQDPALGRAEVEVLVIALYKRQCRALDDATKRLRRGRPRVRIATVDRAQGSEAEHVVLSCVRSNSRRAVGFAKDPRRLNVALSRAKESLTVVGSPKTMARGDMRWNSVYHWICACGLVEPIDEAGVAKRWPMASVSSWARDVVTSVSGGVTAFNKVAGVRHFQPQPTPKKQFTARDSLLQEQPALRNSSPQKLQKFQNLALSPSPGTRDGICAMPSDVQESVFEEGCSLRTQQEDSGESAANIVRHTLSKLCVTQELGSMKCYAHNDEERMLEAWDEALAWKEEQDEGLAWREALAWIEKEAAKKKGSPAGGARQEGFKQFEGGRNSGEEINMWRIVQGTGEGRREEETARGEAGGVHAARGIDDASETRARTAGDPKAGGSASEGRA